MTAKERLQKQVEQDRKARGATAKETLRQKVEADRTARTVTAPQTEYMPFAASGFNSLKQNLNVLQNNAGKSEQGSVIYDRAEEGRALKSNVDKAREELYLSGGRRENEDKLREAEAAYQNWWNANPDLHEKVGRKATAGEEANYQAGKFVKGFGNALQGTIGFVDKLVGDDLAILGSLVDATTGGKTQLEKPIQQWADNALQEDILGADKFGQNVENSMAGIKPSKARDFVGGISESAGAMLPAIATGGAASAAGLGAGTTQALNYLVFGSGAAGNAAKEAINNGASADEAVQYGLYSGMLEVLSESMFAGITGMNPSGALDDILKRLKDNGTIKFLTDTIGEGVEEGIVTFLTPYIARATYDPQAASATWKEMMQAISSGAAMSLLMNSAAAITSGSPEALISSTKGMTEQQVLQDKYGRVEEETVADVFRNGSVTPVQKPAAPAREEVKEPTAKERLLAAVEADKVKAEAAKAKETEKKIPRMELKGIEEETKADTQPAVQSAPAAKPAPTGTATERQRMQARAIGDMVEAGAAAKTSPAALGIENGSDIESITVLEKPLTEMFDFSEASEIAKRAGYEPVYFSGMLQNSNGGTSRWGIAGNKLYIQADSANYTAADIAKEAVERSKTNETISDRGRDERYAGLSAGGQVERVSQQGGSQARRAAARANKAASYAAERASDYISDGSTEQTLKIIPAADYDGELKGIDKTLRKMGAKKVYFTVGSIGIVNPATGESASVSGVYDSDSGVMMVRADSDIYTAQQLAMHEAFHYIADADPTIREDAYNRLLAEMSEGEMDELTARYQVAYGNIYGDNVDAYVDEILADAYAGINRENLGADRYRSTVNSAVMAAARPETEQRQTNGPNERYSISETNDGRAVAVVDDNILSNIDTTVWDKTKKAQAKKAAKKALLAFKDGVQVNGITYKVNKISRDELTRSNDTERLYRKEPEIFADKLRALANADDIITATTSWANDGKLTHPRSDNLIDFVHGEVLIQAGINQYEAETVVGITDTGEYVFYDVVDMEPTSFKVKEEPSTAATSKNAESAIQESSSAGSITEKGNNVKQRFSIEEDSEGRELTKGQKEYFANSKATDWQGRLLTLYHQTENEFTVFDTRRSGAGSRDEKTPFGIFLKSSDTDIGLRGKKQMELYANIENPLIAQNREDLTYQLRRLSPEYDALILEHEALDNEYHQKFEDAKTELRNFMTEWRKNNPDASRRALYDVPEFDRLYNAEDSIIKEWTEKADALSAQAKEVLTQALRDAGYDGVFLYNDAGSWGRSTDAYIALDPEQVKNVDNVNPTKNPDIRYSIEGANAERDEYDSEGKVLSKKQQEFFKDSKMRDKNGNLKVMYHGSQDAGFHVFDPGRSDDNTSLFFVDRNDVAASYSGTYETYEAKSFRSAEDANKFFAEIGKSEYEVVEENGYFTLYDDGDEIATAASLKAIYNEFCDYEGVGYGDANYKVYLNLTNPLEVDAKGAFWNMLNVKTDNKTVRYEVKNVNGKWKIVDNHNGGYLNFEDVVSWRTQEYAQEALDDYLAKHPKAQTSGNAVLTKTRDVAEYAKAKGYDGVIFKNIQDNGGYSNGSEGASTVAIAFSSEQIKSVANAQPTSNPDIRYSADNTPLLSVARKFIREYNSTVDALDVSRELEALRAHIQKNGIDEHAQSQARSIARNIIENASEENADEYKSLRDRIKSTGITLDKAYEHDLMGYENLNEFRKKNFGKIKIVKEGLPVDVFYSELATDYPGLFNELQYNTPADQLMHIADVISELRPDSYNPYSDDIDGATEFAAQEILAGFKKEDINRQRERVLAEREEARQSPIEPAEPAATADEVVERQVAEAKAEAAEENAPELLAAKLSNSRGEFTGSAALEKLGIKVVNSIGKYSNVKQLLGNARAGRSIARERKKAEIRLKVTAKEKNFARGIANGIYTESDIPEGWDKRTVMEMSEWYMAERNFGESYIDLLKQAITVDVDAATAQMFEGADESKVPPAIVLNHRTAQRNMLNIFGDKGKEINKWLFDPVNQNEAERLRFINRQFDQVRTFADQTGKQRALNKAEREMVQRVIEGRVVEDALAKLENRKDIEDAAYNLRIGKDIGDIGLEFGLTLEEQEIVESLVKWQDVQDQLETMDKVIIYNAVDKYSALFDSYYEAINDFLAAHGYQPIGFIKGYVPHLQPEENQTALQNVFQKLGLNTDVSSLPTSIAGLTGDYKPNKKWNPYFLHRNSTVTQFDIVEAFESYVSKMADVLYHADDIMRIRSAVKYFRRTYSPEEIRNSIEWAENLRTMPKDEKIAFLYDEGIITSGAGLSHADAKDMLNKYIEEQYGKIQNTSKFNNLVMYLENYTNILAGKQSIADRGSENSLGRMILNVGNRMTRIFSTANVAGNLSSALNQSAQLPTILAENGLRNTSAAFKDIVTGNLRKAGWAEDSDFLTGKRGVNFIVSTKYEMFLDKAFKPLEIVDSLMSTLAVRGAYLNGIKQGMSHEAAMQYADKKAASIMGDRTKGAKPIQFEAKNPINSMVHLFQVEVLNSWDHIASDLPQDFRTIAAVQGKRKAAQAVAGVISKMLVYSFVLNRLAEKLYGGTPAPFDIFGLTANFIASGQELSTNAYLEALIDKVMLELFGMELFGSDEDERMQLSDGEFEWEAAAEDLGYNISNELPFLNNLSALLGLGDKTLPVPDIITPFEGTYRGIKNKSAAEALDAALHIIEDIVPTGRQIIKTYTGAKMIAQGGKMKGFREKARLQYPVRRTAGNITQALLFGASGLQENQDFYASGRNALTTKETALWKTLVANGADEEDAYNAIYSTKGEDVKTYEKLLMMAAPLEWSNGLKYDAMAGVTSDSFGYKLNVLESNDIDASEYAEVTAEMYDIAAARIADLPEEDRPETVTISQEDAEKALKASNLSKQEKAIIWQMTNAGWSEKSNPFSNSIGKRVKAEYKKIKEQAEEEKRKEEEEDEIPRMQLRGLD